MKPMDVAKRLNIGRSTVAAWSKEFASFLSPTAAGEKNQRRDFSPQDVIILALVKQMTDQSKSREQIGAELHRLQGDDWRELPTLDELISHDPGAQLVTVSTAEASFNHERRYLLREIATRENDVRELKLELADVRGENKEDINQRDARIIELERQLARTELELEWYRSGRLKPSEGS